MLRGMRALCFLSPITANSLVKHSFIDYILVSGDYSDPETRLPLSSETLQRLDIFGKQLGKRSVIKSRLEKAAEFQDQRFVRDAIFGLENIAGDCISDMFDAIEAVNEGRETPEDTTIRLLTCILPVFEDAFKQISAIDVEAARIAAVQFEYFLRGSARKPTPNRAGFLKVVLELFHGACKTE